MRKLGIIGWRPFRRPPLYFRGDYRYEIFLPYLSDERVAEGLVEGWVEDSRVARVFELPIVFTKRSFAKGLDLERLTIFPYSGELLSSQFFHPIKRPRH